LQQSNSVFLTVTCPTITINPATLPNATMGAAYSQTFTQTGGTGTISYAVSAGALPGGLTLTGAMLAGALTQAGTFNFTIRATDANGCTGTRAYTLTSGLAAPTVTTLVPNSAIAATAAFALTVNGSNFVNGSVVKWNGAARATTFVSATQLRAAISASDLAAAATANVTVTNPNNGGTSNAASFTIHPATARYEAVNEHSET
jgi:hypothetical protein